MSAPNGHSWGHYLFSIALTVALFTAVGPLLGAFVIMLPSLFHSPAPLFDKLLELTHAAYAFGGAPAAITGLIVALVSSFVRRDWDLYLISAVTGAVASAGYTMIFSFVTGAHALAELLIVPFLLIGAMAAAVCALFARPLGLRPPQAATSTPVELP